MKPSIVFLGSQIAVGGAQRMLMLQADWFHRQGYSVWAVFFYDRDGLYDQWRTEVDFPLLNLDGWSRDGFLIVNLWRLMRALWYLWRLLHRNRITVVETFTPDSDLLGLPVAFLANVPIRVGCYQGVIREMAAWRTWLHTWLTNSRLTTRFVAVSTQMVDIALKAGIRAPKIVMIPNAVEVPTPEDEIRLRALRAPLRRELGVPEDGVMLFSAGRLSEEKGHRYLLNALPPVLDACPNTVCVLAGDGYLRSELERQAHSLGIEKRVRFLGVRHDVLALLRAADLYVLPSLAEGLSLAMLEAMVAALPLVATRVQGATDVILSGKNGILVPIGNSDALAQELISLICQPETWDVLGQAARRTVLESYTIDKIARQYEQLFFQSE